MLVQVRLPFLSIFAEQRGLRVPMKDEVSFVIPSTDRVGECRKHERREETYQEGGSSYTETYSKR